MYGIHFKVTFMLSVRKLQWLHVINNKQSRKTLKVQEKRYSNYK